MRARLRFRRREEGAPRERGFILVWMVIMLILLLGVTAIAVDLGHALYMQQQLQNAADAGALSGVVHLPDAADKAVQLSNDVAMQNAPDDTSAADSCAQAPACSTLKTNQIQVHMTDKVDTWFAKILGFDSVTVHAEGTAEFDPPVALGSPRSSFGDAPGCAGCARSNEFVNVSAQYDDKNNGNALTMGWCGNTTHENNCPAGGTGLNNQDRDTNGQLFEIDNKGGQPLNLFLFDPAFIDTYDSCEHTQLYGGGGDDPASFPASVWGTGWTSTHLAPEDQPNGSAIAPAYCTGDNTAGNSVKNYDPNAGPATNRGDSVYQDPAVATDTVYSLYELDDPLSPLSGRFVCSFSYQGFWGPANFPKASVSPSQASFHRWDEFTARAGCGSLTAKDYVLQVQTGQGGTKPGGGIVNTDGTVGSNNFAIAACQICGTPKDDAQVSVSAITKMALYSHAAQSDPQHPTFYLARVPSWAAGSTLTVEFYDIGDVNFGSSSAPTLNLKIASEKAKHADGSLVDEFNGCTSSTPDGSYQGGIPSPWDAPAQPDDWGTLSSTGNGGCDVYVSKAAQPKWNGSWVVFQIPIPSDYTCTDADFTDCWTQLQFTLSDPTGRFSDTTTWFAKLSGNPVRLIK